MSAPMCTCNSNSDVHTLDCPVTAHRQRLHAAAADLLDALRAILDHPRTDDRGTIVFMPHEVAAGRAAIAKATKGNAS